MDSRFSQASEESTLRCETGSDPSHIARSTPTAKASSCKECRRGICPKHQFGMIYEPLQMKELGKPFPWMLTSSTAAFHEESHVKTSASQELEEAWKESEADYFSRSCAWPKKSSPSFYSLKMLIKFCQEDANQLFIRLPKSGMIVDMIFFPLESLSTKTEKDGFVLPNLTASDGSKGPGKIYDKKSKTSSQRNLPTISYRVWKSGGLISEVCEKIAGYPTGWTELRH